MCIDQRRICRQRQPILPDRFFKRALRLQCDTEVVARVGEIRLQLQRLVIADHRFMAMAERGGDEAAVAPAGGVGAIEFERFAHQLGSEAVIAALMLQHAEVVQRFGMRGIEREGFAVEGLGVIEPASLMRFERGVEQRGEIGGGQRVGARAVKVGWVFHENLLESACGTRCARRRMWIGDHPRAYVAKPFLTIGRILIQWRLFRCGQTRLADS